MASAEEAVSENGMTFAEEMVSENGMTRAEEPANAKGVAAKGPQAQTEEHPPKRTQQKTSPKHSPKLRLSAAQIPSKRERKILKTQGAF